jgi:hypothetical protein
VAAAGAVAVARNGTAAPPRHMAAIAVLTTILDARAVMWLLMFLATSRMSFYPAGSNPLLNNVQNAGFGLLSVREGLPIAGCDKL